MVESGSTVQKGLKGFSVSCSTLHTPGTLVLGWEKKTCEMLQMMVTSCLFSVQNATAGQFPWHILEPSSLEATGCRQVSAQLLSDLIQRLHRRFQYSCLQLWPHQS